MSEIPFDKKNTGEKEYYVERKPEGMEMIYTKELDEKISANIKISQFKDIKMLGSLADDREVHKAIRNKVNKVQQSIDAINLQVFGSHKEARNARSNFQTGLRNMFPNENDIYTVENFNDFKEKLLGKLWKYEDAIKDVCGGKFNYRDDDEEVAIKEERTSKKEVDAEKKALLDKSMTKLLDYARGPNKSMTDAELLKLPYVVDQIAIYAGEKALVAKKNVVLDLIALWLEPVKHVELKDGEEDLRGEDEIMADRLVKMIRKKNMMNLDFFEAVLRKMAMKYRRCLIEYIEDNKNKHWSDQLLDTLDEEIPRVDDIDADYKIYKTSGFSTNWNALLVLLASIKQMVLEPFFGEQEYTSSDEWWTLNKVWYSPKFKRFVMELHLNGWIRPDSDSDSSFAPPRLLLQNWKETIQHGSYYHDLMWYRRPWKRFFSEAMPIRELIFNKNSLVNPADVDTAVSTIALINALLLLIPIGLIGNLQLSANWDAMYSAGNFNATASFFGNATAPLLVQCSPADFPFSDVNANMANFSVGIVYVSLGCLLLTMLYFFCRPKNPSEAEKDADRESKFWLDPQQPGLGFKAVTHRAEDLQLAYKTHMDRFGFFYTNKEKAKKALETAKDNEIYRRRDWKDPLKLKFAELCQFRFRAWWRRSKWIFLIMAVGTVVSIIMTLALINYYYQNFMLASPASGAFDFCATRIARYRNFVGYYLTLISFVILTALLVA